MSGEWKLTCVGLVERVEEQDLDKTKRNPNVKLVLDVRPESMEAEREGIDMPESLRFGIMERDLRRAGKGRPEEGLRLRLEGAATGIRPVLVTLKQFEILETMH